MRKLISKLLIIPAAILVVFSLANCSADEPAPAKTVMPADINGTWTGDIFSATIDGNSIVVYIVDNESKSLYWKGTFPAIQENKVTSAGDRETMDGSLMGSGDAEKVFDVSDGQVSFDFTMMGTTKTVHLSKE